MKKILLVFSLVISTLLLIGSVSSYVCIYQADNIQVQEFKLRLNQLSLQNDINSGLSEQQIITKLKYFNPCR